MRKPTIVLALATVTLTPFAAAAEQYVSGRAGFYFPDAGGFDTGYSLNVAYGLGLGDLAPGTVRQHPGLAAVDTEFGLGIYQAENDGPFGDVELTVIPVTASAVYTYPLPDTSFEVYAGGGPGFYFAMVDTPGGDDNDLEFGIHVLAGGAFNLTPQIDLFTELRGDLATDDVGGGFFNFGLKYNF